jgi:chromosome segregation ATPase
MLTTQGVKSKSTLLNQLAVQIRADPFAKIKKLIQDTIERLLHEAAEEANQKGWCDKAQADAKQKRTYAAEEIEALNGEMASLEGRRNKLAEELEVLRTEIPDLKEKRDEADKMREEEKAENERTVEEATAGLEAINMAIDILDKFYKTAAKSKVDLSLAQGPADEAPGAGFEIGEAYTGAGGESGGILGMMDVIKSDFERTISETEKAEKKATTDHRNFMTETGKSLAEKTMAEEQKDDQHANTVEELDSAKDSLTAEASILSTSIQELIELKPTCIDTGMSYEERVARREDEIESLKKALCIFENFADGGFEDAC